MWEYSEGGGGGQVEGETVCKYSEWVSGGGACHYVMDLHMAKHPGTIYYILYIENFMAQIFFENLVY